MNYLLLIVSLIIWIELIVKLLSYKNATSATIFLSYIFGIPMPSMFIGIIVRILLIAAASVGTYLSITRIINI